MRMTISPARAEEFTAYVRIPGWSRETTVRVNGKTVQGAVAGQYLALKRRWAAGESVVEISFDMRTTPVHANPAVVDDRGRVAMQRGPLVYCMEGLDQADATQDGGDKLPLYHARLDGATHPEWRADLLGGVTVLRYEGGVAASKAGGPLYAATDIATKVAPATKAAQLQLIPYYAWANREASAMQVWIPVG